MTVVIAAADDAGEAAREALQSGEFDVILVRDFASACQRLHEATVLVVGDVPDATVDDVWDVVESEDPHVPVVGLGVDGPRFDHTVETPPEPDVLRHTVRMARQTSEYYAAVDELYEQCRARAIEQERNGGDTSVDEAVDAARERADSEFLEARRLSGRTPYAKLVDESDEEEDEDAFYM